MRKALVCLLAVPVFVMVSCQTATEIEPSVPGAATPEFVPLVFVSAAKTTGQYEIYSPDSFAVWVAPEVAKMKLEDALAKGEVPDATLQRDAVAVVRDYIVVECHVQSAFSDMSVAYDAIQFRNVSAYLSLPDGRNIQPLQSIIGPVSEEPEGALKRYKRTNLLVFPRRDLWDQRLTLDPSYASVRLVLDGYNSTAYFEWPEASEASGLHEITPAEHAQAIKLGFRDLFERVRRVVHIFD